MNKIMVMFKYFLAIIYKTNPLFWFFLFIFFSPIYANEYMLKLKCDVNNFSLSSEKGEWESEKISSEVGVDLLSKNLIKKDTYSYAKDKTYTLKDKFKILSVSKNGLVAISHPLKSTLTGAPSVGTITLDNLSDSNALVGLTYTIHLQLNESSRFIVQYGKCSG